MVSVVHLPPSLAASVVKNIPTTKTGLAAKAARCLSTALALAAFRMKAEAYRFALIIFHHASFFDTE